MAGKILLIMKRLLLILGATALVTSFTACSKMCTCTHKAAGSSATTQLEVNLKDEGVSKCSDLDYTYEVSPGFSPETMKCK